MIACPLEDGAEHAAVAQERIAGEYGLHLVRHGRAQVAEESPGTLVVILWCSDERELGGAREWTSSSALGTWNLSNAPSNVAIFHSRLHQRGGAM